jgi:hypothetical protein
MNIKKNTMTRRIQYILLSLAAAITLSSCEDVIPVDLDKGETLLVVEGRITDDTTQNYKVTLSTTTAYFENKETPRVSGAFVEIKDYDESGNLVVTDTLVETVPGSGTYFSNDLNGKTYHRYVLTVRALGEEYKAETQVNRPVPIDSLTYEYKEESFGYEKGYYVFYNGPELPGKGDYFLFKVYKNGEVYDQPDEIWFESDELVDGNYIGDIDITPEPFELGDTIKVETYTITRDQYYFYAELFYQVNNFGLFANPPANVRTNIFNVNPSGAKAVGYFGGSGLTSKEIVIK